MPGDVQQTFNTALDLHKAGNFRDAEKLYRDVVEAAPDHYAALHLLGLVEMKGGRHREGITHIAHAIAAAPKPFAEFHANIAVGLKAIGELDRAIDHLKIAAALKPEDLDVHFRLGVLAMAKGASDDAAAHFRRAIGIKPDFAKAHGNLGAALQRLGQLDDAFKALSTAVSLDPRDVDAHYNLGIVLKDMGRIKEAVASFAIAASLDPQHAEAQWNLSLGNLLLGDLAAGWKTFDWYKKIQVPSVQAFTQPAWDGGGLDGKTILLVEAHGYGDTLQFVRYVPLLKKRASKVVILCRPELVRLLETVPGVDAVTSSEKLPPYDCYASFFDLPKLMGTVMASIPHGVPYLFPQAGLVAAWRDRGVLKERGNVGIVWRGNKTTDPRRAMTVDHAAKICGTPGFNWISLQIGIDDHERRALAASGVQDCGARLSDWADTAALISTLDLVVTVDTGVAHVAGALGKAVWIMLPLVPDWRWLLERDDSPWYPTAKVFRQPALGDWSTVTARIQNELKARV